VLGASPFVSRASGELLLCQRGIFGKKLRMQPVGCSKVLVVFERMAEGNTGTMKRKNTQNKEKTTPEKEQGSKRSSSRGKKLNPALKSWLDNVIIPALVREYIAETRSKSPPKTPVTSA